MVLTINVSFVSNISVVGNLSNLDFSSLIERFAGLTINNFPKDSNSTRIR